MESSSEIFQGLQESLESADWLVAHPDLPLKRATGQTAVPGARSEKRSLAAVPASWRPPGTYQNAQLRIPWRLVAVHGLRCPRNQGTMFSLSLFALSDSSRGVGKLKEKEEKT